MLRCECVSERVPNGAELNEGWLESRVYLRGYNYRINYSQRSLQCFCFILVCVLFVFVIIVIKAERGTAMLGRTREGERERERELFRRASG